MESRNSSMDDKVEDLSEVIEKFLNNSNASDARQVLEKYPELLSDDADSMLDALSRDSQNRETIEKILYCRSFLTRCREVGIVQAFEETSSSSNESSEEDLQNIIGKVFGLSKAHDIPRKIAMIQNALSLVPFKSNPELWIALQVELSNSIYQNPQGNQTENIEKAIEHYNQILKVLTPQNFSVEEALVHNNLANAYWSRIKGDKAENLEKAIKYSCQALKIYTQKDFPTEWAMAQNNLANAYCDRIIGNRAENVEKAIKHYNQALDVYKKQNLTMEWARTLNNLAAAYGDRIIGDRGENIDKTIEYLNQVLVVFTEKSFPIYWAGTHHNLGNAYWTRIRGDRAENVEKSIKHYHKALTVRTQNDFPVDWALTQNNLANAYSNRIKGNRAENIEKAIEHYNQALIVRTQNDFPEDWAGTQNNLANAYRIRIHGDKGGNIKKAIEHCNLVLKVYTYKDFPMEWAGIQHNMGNAYSDHIKGNRAENIEKAIEHYNQALIVYSHYNSSVELALIQNNLALAYRDRIKGNRHDNIAKSVNLFQKALEIYKLESTPDSFRNTCRSLGDLYLNIGEFENALESYKDAIKAGNLLYLSGLSSESKAVEVRENVSLYRNASLAACRLDLATEALLTLERGKTRLLSEALKLKMKKPEEISNEEWMKYEHAAERYRISITLSGQEDYIQREKKVQSALGELNAAVRIIQEYDPEFQKELDILNILSIPDKETALLTFCITGKGSIGFVINESSGVQSVDISGFRIEDLDNLLFQFDEQGTITGGWIGNYLSYHSVLGTKSHEDAFQSWQMTFSNVLSCIGAKLLDPLLVKLSPQIKRLILLPCGGLFLLPLHAVPLSDGQLLCQKYYISYAPSIQLLMEMQNKAGKVEGKELYAVINPQEDPALVFSGCEGQFISKFFQFPLRNVGETSTKPTVLYNIPGKAYLHFSCHGSYDWNDPSQSGLHLFGGRTLSLADLQSDIVDMSSARLVTLSACETGITDILKGSADEFVGLPAGFMLAGVPCVVSSLWSVPDISTAILMERFYSNHIIGGMDIPLALQDAQLWVRDLNAKQVADYVEKCYRSGKWEGISKEFIEKYRERYLKIAEESSNEKPFQHPYYWAAFAVNGV